MPVTQAIQPKWFAVVAVLLLAALLWLSPNKPLLIKLQGQTMGTQYHVVLWNTEKSIDRQALQLEIDQQLNNINQSMSSWLKDSELNQLNNAPIKQWIKISPQLFEVIAEAQRISDLSRGAFDITVAPAVDAWGFSSHQLEQSPPNDNKLKSLEIINYQHLHLDKRQKSVLKTNHLRIDLSAIAKGYAIDKLAQLMKQHGINNYLLEIGGEIRSLGMKENSPWKIAIERPNHDYSSPRQAQKIIELPNQGIAMATSGDYRNFFEYQGKNYSHTIDPKTAKPVKNQLASASVILNQSTIATASADAMATALMVMGFDEAKAFAQEHKLAVYLIQYLQQEQFMEYQSPAFTAFNP